MKDKEIKFEEIQDSHTPLKVVWGKVVSKGEGSGEGVDATLESNMLRYLSLVDLARDWGWL